jgi:DNA repair protein RAD50
MRDEAGLDAAQTLAGDLQRHTSDMEDKQTRLKKMQGDFSAANYNAKIEEKVKRVGELEVQRNTLNAEFRKLNSQADVRAKLDLKRAEVKAKTQDVKNMYVLFS